MGKTVPRSLRALPVGYIFYCFVTRPLLLLQPPTHTRAHTQLESTESTESESSSSCPLPLFSSFPFSTPQSSGVLLLELNDHARSSSAVHSYKFPACCTFSSSALQISTRPSHPVVHSSSSNSRLKKKNLPDGQTAWLAGQTERSLSSSQFTLPWSLLAGPSSPLLACLTYHISRIFKAPHPRYHPSSLYTHILLATLLTDGSSAPLRSALLYSALFLFNPHSSTYLCLVVHRSASHYTSTISLLRLPSQTTPLTRAEQASLAPFLDFLEGEKGISSIHWSPCVC